MKNWVFYISLFFLFTSNLNSQTFVSPKDTALNRSYDYLKTKVLKLPKEEISSAIEYGKSYMLKAKMAKSTNDITIAHHLLSIRTTGGESIAHMDSIIMNSSSNKNERYPAIGYILKGTHFYNIRDFKASLENFIQATKELNDRPNPRMKLTVIQSVGLLKERIGEYDEALEAYHEVLAYARKNGRQNSYAVLLFGLSSVYCSKATIDSATYYTRLGMQVTRKNNDPFHNYFVLMSGIVEFQKGNFVQALDSINKAKTYFQDIDDKPNEAFAHYYLGLTKSKINRQPEAIDHFKKVDTIFMEIGDIHPHLRGAWESLIDHYNYENSPVEELIYVKKLLRIDSVLNDNYRYLDKNIYAKYDVPELLEKKNELNDTYRSGREKFLCASVILAGILAVAGLGMLLIRKKFRNKVKKYEEIITEMSTGVTISSNKPKISNSNLGLNAEVVDLIESGLLKLEESKFYLDNQASLVKTASKLNTNSKYLSAYINHFKNKNFKNYLNDLRIDYASKRMKEDRMFRKWTLEAIAIESGFNSREYFGKAFRKKHGLKPSFFLEQLNNHRNS